MAAFCIRFRVVVVERVGGTSLYAHDDINQFENE